MSKRQSLGESSTAPAWKTLYQAALSVPISEDVHRRIAAAEMAILERTRELSGGCPCGTEEPADLEDALYVLRAFKTSQRFSQHDAA